MTLQQLRNIVAIDRYRSYAKAAEACAISQPTLSAISCKREANHPAIEKRNTSVSCSSGRAVTILT